MCLKQCNFCNFEFEAIAMCQISTSPNGCVIALDARQITERFREIKHIERHLYCVVYIKDLGR